MSDILTDWDDETPEEKQITAAVKPDINAGFENVLDDTAGMLALGANSKYFGLGPKVANILGSIIPGPKGQGLDWERKTDDYLNKQRENLGPAAWVAELYGGLKSRLPGQKSVSEAIHQGFNKIPLGGNTFTRVVKAGAESGIDAGLQGFGQGAIRSFGENASGFDPDAAIQSGWEGGKTGAGFAIPLGIGFGGFAQALSDRANNARFAATGTGVGKVKQQQAMSPNQWKPGVYDRIKNQTLPAAEEEGLIGAYPLQSASNVNKRAYTLTQQVGKEMEDIVTRVGPKARVDPTRLTDDIINALDEYTGPNTSSEQHQAVDAALGRFMEFFYSKQTGKVRSLTAQDLMEWRNSLRKGLTGPANTRTPADNLNNELIHKLRAVAGKHMVEAVKGANPNEGAALRLAMDRYNAARTVGDFSADSVARWDTTMETPFGKGIRGVMVGLLSKAMGVPNIPAAMITAATNAPGQVPNTIIWADRMRRAGRFGDSAKNASVLQPVSKNYSGLSKDNTTPFGSYTPPSNLSDDSQ